MRAGIEKGVGAGLSELGGRYEAGVSYRVIERLTLAAEAWGVLEWPDDSPFQYAHHAGLTAKVQLGRWWLASNLSAGLTERPAVTFLDYTCLLMLGIGG